MPASGETPQACHARAVSLQGTPGAAYLERRGIPCQLASSADVRFLADCDGRPAVVVLLRDAHGSGTALHARYLEHTRSQNKMLTFGVRGGVIAVLPQWRADPLILVEGLFDALSLAVCGYASIATIGRWADWLPGFAARRTVWLAFDGNRPGDALAHSAAALLCDSQVRRLRPPDRCKDWNTALVKRGPAQVARALRASLAADEDAKR
jgi:hypothetical protein